MHGGFPRKNRRAHIVHRSFQFRRVGFRQPGKSHQQIGEAPRRCLPGILDPATVGRRTRMRRPTFDRLVRIQAGSYSIQ